VISRNYLVLLETGTKTIDRKTKLKNEVFTKKHKGHSIGTFGAALYAIGNKRVEVL
jgi:hypothetical protein